MFATAYPSEITDLLTPLSVKEVDLVFEPTVERSAKPDEFFTEGEYVKVCVTDHGNADPNLAEIYSDLVASGKVYGCPSGCWIETNPAQAEFYCRPDVVATITQRAEGESWTVGCTRPMSPRVYRAQYKVVYKPNIELGKTVLHLLEGYDAVKFKIQIRLAELESRFSPDTVSTNTLPCLENLRIGDAYSDFPLGSKLTTRQFPNAIQRETCVTRNMYTTLSPYPNFSWNRTTVEFPSPDATFSAMMYAGSIRSTFVKLVDAWAQALYVAPPFHPGEHTE